MAERAPAAGGAGGRLGALLGWVDTACAAQLQLKGAALPQLRFFTEGWGDLQGIQGARAEFDAFLEEYQAQRTAVPAVQLGPWRCVTGGSACQGQFPSPLPSRLPEESRTCEFELVVPQEEPWAVVIHFPGTGDQTYLFRRHALAQPLAQQGVASLLITPAFYGKRRPQAQQLHYVNNVSDFVNQTHTLMAEALQALDWARQQYPRALLGCTGLSWGGAMTIVLASVAKRHDLALAPCLPAGSPRVLVTGALKCEVTTKRIAAEDGSSGAEADEALLSVLSSQNAQQVQQQVDALPGRKGEKAAVQVSASHDTFVPAADAVDAFVTGVASLDPQAELRWIKGGHCSSFAAARFLFVEPVLRSLRQLSQKVGRRGCRCQQPRARL